MKILISGASGKLGRRVTELALESVDPGDLILTTRTPESLSELAERGVEVRHADFNDPAQLPEAFSGAERMLLISTDAVGSRGPQHDAAIEAATIAGVEFVAYTSFVRAEPDNPSFVAPEHVVAEKKLRDSGLQWCFLRNGVYGDAEADAMAYVLSTGKLVTNNAEGRVAYVARDDCAAAAAAVLTGGDHAGKTYDITGPEAVDAEARAAIFSEVGGKPVEVVHVDDDAFATGLAEARGLPPEVARAIAVGMGRATREGYFDVVSSAVADLTGRKPMSLRTVLERAAQ